MVLSEAAFAQTGKDTRLVEKSKNGNGDRDYWVALLLKISNPVIQNLADETLRQNMPLDTAPGYYLKADQVSYLEAVGRTIAGLAPWLALPDDDTKESTLRKNKRAMVISGLKNAVNPASPDYLNFSSGSQPLVDAAFLAHGFVRAPQALWDPLDSVTKKRYIAAFKSLRSRKAAYSNWLLFAGMTETFLMMVGEEYDPARIDIALRKMREWYVGDGWYSDGETFSMDYYNSFVIHPMLVDILKITVEKKFSPQAEYEEALKRMIRHAEFLERMISPEGSFPVFGRSMTYRTGVFQALSQAALMKKLPQSITPAQVRHGLTAVLRRMFDDNDANFGKQGWLRLGFNGDQAGIADPYTSTGSLYLTTLSFLPLGLPASDPFWTDPPADWTSKKAWSGAPVKRDYKVSY